MTQPSQWDNFDNFLYGMALSNHATYLGSNWNCPPQSCGHAVTAYLAGMGEHLVYLVFKVTTLTAFFFLNIFFTLHYLTGKMQDVEESELTKREIRLYVGLLVMGETLPGCCIDLLGVACPPLAYRAHTFVKDKMTRRYFEQWGIVEHTTPREEFNALNYFGKIV